MKENQRKAYYAKKGYQRKSISESVLNMLKSNMESQDMIPVRTTQYGSLAQKNKSLKVEKKLEIGAYAGVENCLPKAGIYGKLTLTK